MELETFYDLVANLGADTGTDRIDLHRVGPDGSAWKTATGSQLESVAAGSQDYL